jgi:hypothetical protein
MESNPMLWAQCQTEAENLHWGWGSISNRDLLSLRQARRAEIASRLERHQITLGQANVEMSIMQSQTSETSKRQANPAQRLGPIVVEDGLQRTVTTIRDKRMLL